MQTIFVVIQTNAAHLWHTEQWCALSGLMLQHFGHLKITSRIEIDFYFSLYKKGTGPIVLNKVWKLQTNSPVPPQTPFFECSPLWHFLSAQLLWHFTWRRWQYFKKKEMDCFYTGICEHCAQVRADSKESKALWINFRIQILLPHDFKIELA